MPPAFTHSVKRLLSGRPNLSLRGCSDCLWMPYPVVSPTTVLTLPLASPLSSTIAALLARVATFAH